jgi:hypothetical protein
MYAEQHETTKKFNLMELSLKQLQTIEVGLSSIHLNTDEHVEAYFIQKQIDKDLSE